MMLDTFDIADSPDAYRKPRRPSHAVQSPKKS